jgi:penicillin-binding protein 2
MTGGKDPSKEEVQKRRHFAVRLNLFFFSVFLLFSILIIRLAIIQFVEGEQLKALKDSNQVAPYDIPPIRGNIYDRNGYPIAVSTSTQSLYYQYDIGQSQDEVIALARRLERIFAEYGHPDKMMTAEEIVLAMDAGFDIHKNRLPIMDYYSSLRRIKTDLTNEEVAWLMEHRDEMKNISIVEESVREYDGENRIAVQLVGYLRQYSTAINHLPFYANTTEKYLMTENVGFDGIEFMYEKELRGKPGSRTYPINALGQIIGNPVITPPTVGNNLYLTIDAEVQQAAKQKIIEHLEYLKTDPVSRSVNKTGINAASAYAVAMEVKTGKVIAMVSYPDYDPNIWRNGRISPKDWNENQYRFLNGTITGTLYDHPEASERARHPGSLVPPGSTMKPLTILVGLQEGLIKPSTVYNDTGVFYYGRDNSRVSNSNGRAYGQMNAERAIAVSSNTFMAAMIGDPLYRKYGRESVQVWDSYMTQFGLGVTTGSGLPGESAGVRDYFNMVESSSAQAAMVLSSFGQGARYTPLQLVQYTATLANRGARVKPQFVEKITTYDGKTVSTFEPEILNTVEMPDEYWDVVQRGMERVTQQGFDGFPYKLASKTGTAESDTSAGRVENAVFIAYAPADNPKLAVAVVVPEGGYGAWGAAPIARAIFDAYDRSIGLTDEEQSP